MTPENISCLHRPLKDYNKFFIDYIIKLDMTIMAEDYASQDELSEVLDTKMCSIISDWVTMKEFLIFPTSPTEDDEFSEKRFGELINSLLENAKEHSVVNPVPSVTVSQSLLWKYLSHPLFQEVKYVPPHRPQPQYVQPQYVQPQYVQPQYVQPQYVQPQYSQQYAQPQYPPPQYAQQYAPQYAPQFPPQFSPHPPDLVQLPLEVPPAPPAPEVLESPQEQEALPAPQISQVLEAPQEQETPQSPQEPETSQALVPLDINIPKQKPPRLLFDRSVASGMAYRRTIRKNQRIYLSHHGKTRKSHPAA
jgi:hypothetical protein